MNRGLIGLVFGCLLFTSGAFPGDPATEAVVHGHIKAKSDRVLDFVARLP